MSLRRKDSYPAGDEMPVSVEFRLYSWGKNVEFMRRGCQWDCSDPQKRLRDYIHVWGICVHRPLPKLLLVRKFFANAHSLLKCKLRMRNVYEWCGLKRQASSSLFIVVISGERMYGALSIFPITVCSIRMNKFRTFSFNHSRWRCLTCMYMYNVKDNRFPRNKANIRYGGSCER